MIEGKCWIYCGILWLWYTLHDVTNAHVMWLKMKLYYSDKKAFWIICMPWLIKTPAETLTRFDWSRYLPHSHIGLPSRFARVMIPSMIMMNLQYTVQHYFVLLFSNLANNLLHAATNRLRLYLHIVTCSNSCGVLKYTICSIVFVAIQIKWSICQRHNKESFMLLHLTTSMWLKRIGLWKTYHILSLCFVHESTVLINGLVYVY